MADEAGEESGGEKSMDNSIKINEVPAGIEEGRGRRSRKGFQRTIPVRIRIKILPATAQ